MTTASNLINGALSKGRDVLGTVGAVSSILPPSLRNSLNSFINGPGVNSGLAPRNVSTFRALLGKVGGVARNNLYHVSIPVPNMIRSSSLGATFNETSRNLPLLCEQAALPGVALATSDIKRYGIGPMEKKPYSVVFTDQSFTFIGDNTGSVHRYFTAWMNGIVKYDIAPSDSTTQGYNQLGSFEVEYKKDYAVDITITCVDDVNRNIIICTLMEAYPIFLGDVSLTWADNDSYMKIPVTFTYLNWRLDQVNINSALGAPVPSMSPLQKLLKVGSAVQTLASLRKPTGVADVLNIVNNAKIATGGLQF